MSHSINLQAAVLAAVVTVSTVAGMHALAGRYHDAAAHEWQLAQAQPAWPSVHQVVVTGTHVQQVVVTGRRG